MTRLGQGCRLCPIQRPSSLAGGLHSRNRQPVDSLTILQWIEICLESKSMPPCAVFSDTALLIDANVAVRKSWHDKPERIVEM
jgi:hypothetical protein